jgi:phospholipase/carboxylesterase
MYTHNKQYITAGKPIAEAGGALIMIHGRGGSAENIISLAGELNATDLTIFAPQASNHSWYPYSFMAADDQNQPALNSAIEVIGELVDEIIGKGIPAEKIYFLGFSQGACLTLEYITRNAQRYGGAVAFTGGLIGQQLDVTKYNGDFNGTPVLITTGNPDPHVPLTRVEESAELLKKLNADVNITVFNGRPHTIIQQEIDLANKYVLH